MPASLHDGSARRARRAIALLLTLLTLAVALPAGVLVTAAATPREVTGTLSTKDPVTFGAGAVAVVAIVDRSVRGGEGVIVGARRFAASGTTPISFAVSVDPARIDPGHSYQAFATIIDGTTRRETAEGVPVITGGPSTGVDLRLRKAAGNQGAVVTGSIAMKDKAALSGKALAFAALVDLDSGRTVAWTTVLPAGTPPIPFALGYDPAGVDPGARLGVWAAIVDGKTVREAPAVEPALDGGSGDAGTIVVAFAPAIPPAPRPTPSPTPPPVAVPEVRGLTQDDATGAIVDADLRVGELLRRYNATVPNGRAVKTKPAAGTLLAPRTPVKLTVSRGPSPSPSPVPSASPAPTAAPAKSPKPSGSPALVAVPQVRNLPEADAIARINAAGLLLGTRERRANGNVEAGSAIRTAPEEGTRVAAGSRVDLILSTGPAPTPTPAPVSIPNLRGRSEADAVIALSEAGLGIGERRSVINASVAAGLVVRTEPEGGTRVPPMTQVAIVLSAGPSPSPTPAPTPTPAPLPSPTPAPVFDAYLSGLLLAPPPADGAVARDVTMTLIEETAEGTRIVPAAAYLADGASPQAFVLAYPADRIDPAATYRVLAALTEGDATWFTPSATLAIAGGRPVSGLILPLERREDLREGEVTGVVIGPPSTLSETATLEVLLVRGDTGAVVGYGAESAAEAPLLFAVPFLVGVIDPEVPTLAVARVTDGDQVWTGPGVPVITLGAPFRVVIEIAPDAGSAPLDAPDA